MISIIIPVYNQHDMTRDCLAAVRANTQDHEIIIVDNGSEPPIEGAAIRNEENRGFPVAVNQGIRAASGDIIVLLNNDVIVTEGWAERLTKALEDFSIVAPVANYTAGLQKAAIGNYDDEKELNAAANEWAQRHSGITKEVNFIIGFCMMFRRSLFDEIGPFDESLWPCSGEEIDFCMMARKAGHRIGIAIDCYVHHEGSQTFNSMDLDYTAICNRNDAHLAERWGDGFWNRQAVYPSGIRLNLGCGRFPLSGFTNIDQEEDLKPDLVADVLSLPFEPGTVQEINAGHLLEHFDWVDGDKALRYWHRLLKPGGKIFITVPDIDVIMSRYMKSPTPEGLRDMNDLYIYSYKQRSPHRYAYSADLLKEKMENCGFTDLKRLPINHPYFVSPVDWQCGFEGVKS